MGKQAQTCFSSASKRPRSATRLATASSTCRCAAAATASPRCFCTTVTSEVEEGEREGDSNGQPRHTVTNLVAQGVLGALHTALEAAGRGVQCLVAPHRRRQLHAHQGETNTR